MRRISNYKLPTDKPLYYNADNLEFLFSYDNGGMIVTGNNTSVANVPIEDVIANLLNRIENLEYQLTANQSKEK